MKLDFNKFEGVRVFKVKIQGITPYMQNKLHIEEVHDPKKKSKNKNYDPKKEAEKAIYRNKDGVFIPERHIKSAMIKSATDYTWKGQKTYKDLVQSSIFIEPEEIPLKAGKYVIDIRPEWVRTGGAKIPKPTARPKWNKWSAEFKLIVLDERIPNEVIPEILAGAGLRYGIGELHKRGMGKFKIVFFEKVG